MPRMVNVCRSIIVPLDHIGQNVSNTLVLNLKQPQQIRPSFVKHQTKNFSQIGNPVLKPLLVPSIDRRKFQIGDDR